MGSRTRRGSRGLLGYAVVLVLLSIYTGVASRTSFAEGAPVSLHEEIRGLEATLQTVLNHLDQSARRSEALSEEVQGLKAQKGGVLHHVRLEGLLSQLRQILLERRELKKLERDLQTERGKKARLLYDLMGKEINLLLQEAEGLARQGHAAEADRIQRAVLEKMQTREALRKHPPVHIAALPRIEFPDLDGASPLEIKEIAVLLRNDAETLDRKRGEMEEECRVLREELKTKQMLSRVQGFPRGIEREPVTGQIRSLEARIAALSSAIEQYAERVRALSAMSDEILERSKREEDRFK